MLDRRNQNFVAKLSHFYHGWRRQRSGHRYRAYVQHKIFKQKRIISSDSQYNNPDKFTGIHEGGPTGNYDSCRSCCGVLTIYS